MLFVKSNNKNKDNRGSEEFQNSYQRKTSVKLCIRLFFDSARKFKNNNINYEKVDEKKGDND